MLKLQNISKKYHQNQTLILNNINLELNKGDIVGLIGKNGAGKTTLMKIIAKCQKPTTGEIYYDNTNINDEDNLLTEFGFMINQIYYPNFTSRQNLLFYLTVNNLNKFIPKITEILKFVGLADDNKKVKHFSFGMKQRLCLAIALITEPKIAVLDEPFIGLDPKGIEQLIKLLQDYASKYAATFLISSHQLNELSQICNRLVLLENGEIKELTKYDYLDRLRIIYLQQIDNREELMSKFNFIIAINHNSIEIINENNNFQLINQEISPHNTLITVENIDNQLSSYFQ
ncbi:ABC transporter ATP-binding protein [Staphylococcus simiae]|uniref:ABC transporter ATP-binding protein n=1 Tax=Staphylococcus simiae TaxID=308354 RepID=UPI001A96C709|nr:ABC transporter ATP-binding protein [Staphylococcus simiae]MBO1197809.1 ABC transporter ATP-binding protein [Staphylococcus simiae]MBO1200529.1 ABC transporter ATP-binding protein [Staphylococcus simiae]MBO1202801.1 ABC transporter ATP-binding protein [Staphylococcus simiae]MBO1211828.1 ABC transporter ATP-binding protein [Staphylococcus simiae]MBO1229760.1 ABC transporter ATP-binding protein [Staphylococcus simiae]